MADDQNKKAAKAYADKAYAESVKASVEGATLAFEFIKLVGERKASADVLFYAASTVGAMMLTATDGTPGDLLDEVLFTYNDDVRMEIIAHHLREAGIALPGDKDSGGEDDDDEKVSQMFRSGPSQRPS